MSRGGQTDIRRRHQKPPVGNGTPTRRFALRSYHSPCLTHKILVFQPKWRSTWSSGPPERGRSGAASAGGSAGAVAGFWAAAAGGRGVVSEVRAGFTPW